MVAAFIGFGAIAWLHFHVIGRVILPGVTVWIAWYGAMLLTLCWLAVRSGDRAMQTGAAIMAASFVCSHLIWNVSAWPITAHSIKNVLIAAALIGAARFYVSRPLLVAACIHLALVAIGFLADFGMLFSGKRPMQFIAWSFADVSAGLQHASLIATASRSPRSEAGNLGGDHRSRRSGWDFRLASLTMHSRRS